MTERLYLTDSYMKEFEATVTKVSEGKYAVLNRTAFYAISGGQPNDTGKLIVNGDELNVVFVKAFGEEVSHEIEGGEIKEGDKVKGIIDWRKRFKLMRMHSSAHILAAVIYKELGSLITGGQLGEEKSRMDFNVRDFDRELLTAFEEKANAVVKQAIPITVEFLPYEEAMAMPEIFRLKNVLPKNLKELRVVKMGDFDAQADGGTHVGNTSEVGKIHITKLENKGAENRRICWVLGD
ncbi:MAG: alanyl-tRNA editing protein [Candidatus Diapherotrites archaeon]